MDWEENREGERGWGMAASRGRRREGDDRGGHAEWVGCAWWLAAVEREREREREIEREREAGWQQGRKRLDWEENREGERGYGMAASTGRRRETEGEGSLPAECDRCRPQGSSR